MFSFSISSEVIFQLIKSFDLKALKKLLVSGNKLLTGVFLVKLLEKNYGKLLEKLTFKPTFNIIDTRNNILAHKSGFSLVDSLCTSTRSSNLQCF